MEKRNSYHHYDLAAARQLDRLMLQYRPIAPKPLAPGDAPVVVPESGGGRRKRKRGGKVGSVGRRARRAVVPKNDNTAQTLPLTPERKEEPPTTPSPTSSGQAETGKLLVAPLPVRVFGSWVMVERVTEAWGEEEVGWRCGGDESMMQMMERDDSPCFVSGCGNRVVWMNVAYRRMVVGEEEAEVRVGLATRGVAPPAGKCRAFTCHVTVRHACRRGGRATLAAPCDVWCMGGGRLAWRVDAKAALSLSLGQP